MSARFPFDLVLAPVSRWPTTLADDSLRAVIEKPVEDCVRCREAAPRPLASIVVVTFGGLLFTRLCLETLLAADSTIDFEVIVVDNASPDDTPRYLTQLAALDRRVRVVLNCRNTGFAAATNHGVASATGDIIVFLNNDTMPVGSWLDRLVAHLRNRDLGLVGAVTNRAGNEAEIDAPYRTHGELRAFAARRTREYSGKTFDLRTATMFCAAMRRDVWNAVGPLDERFEIGLFEDDDFSVRVRRDGFRVVCAEDAFVHHFGQASIGQLAATGEYGALFHANRQRWEEKWGVAWQPYAKRQRPGYQSLVARVRQLVGERVPPGATVLVVSKGDDELLKFDGRHGRHFPQRADGTYAGHHPADSDACIAELERLRTEGADYLVIPETSRWWLRHYARFAEHLETQYRLRVDEDCAGLIVALSSAAVAQAAGRGV